MEHILLTLYDFLALIQLTCRYLSCACCGQNMTHNFVEYLKDEFLENYSICRALFLLNIEVLFKFES